MSEKERKKFIKESEKALSEATAQPAFTHKRWNDKMLSSEPTAQEEKNNPTK